MDVFGLTARDMGTIKGVLRKCPAITSVQIFGSRALSTYKPASDIDLAIMDSNVTDDDIAIIKQEFEESSLPYFVDLIAYNQLNHDGLKEHIDAVGIPFYRK